MDREKVKTKLFIWYTIFCVLFLCALYLAYGIYFIDTTSTKSKWIGLFAGSIGILFSFCKIVENSYFAHKNQTIEKIVRYFKTGINIFSKTSNKFIYFIALIIGIILYRYLGYKFIICYTTGIITAEIISYLIKNTTTINNVKLSYSNSNNLKQTNKLALNTAQIQTFIGFSLCIVCLDILLHIFKGYYLEGYLLGFCLITTFNILISSTTKKATNNAILAMQDIYNEFDNNDKRNPLLLLHGLSTSIFKINILSLQGIETLLAALVSSIIIGQYSYNIMGSFFPIIVVSSAIFVSIPVSLLTRISDNSKNQSKIFFITSFITVILFIFVNFYTVKIWFIDCFNIFYSLSIGAISGYILCFVNLNYIDKKYKPIKNIAHSINANSNILVFQTIKEGFNSTFVPIFVISFTIISAFIFSYGLEAPSLGLYGIALAILASISTVGIVNTIALYSLNNKNTRKIESSYEEDISVSAQNKEPNDNLFKFCAMAKNFIQANNILTSLCILIAYTIFVEIEEVDLLNPYVMTALLIGAILPFIFSGFILTSAIKTTGKLIVEVKKQLRHFPQIMNFEMRPNYEHAVEVASINSSIKSIFAIMGLILIFVVVGFYLKQEAIAGLIMGTILGSIGLTLFASNSSNAIKGAKKYFTEEYRNAAYMDEYGAIANSEVMFSAFNELITPCISSIVKLTAILALAISPMYLQ